MAVVSVASAAETTQVDLEIEPGTVTIEAPALIDFGSITVSSSEQTPSVDLASGTGYFIVEDLEVRTWYVDLITTAMSAAGANDLEATDIAVKTFGDTITVLDEDTQDPWSGAEIAAELAVLSGDTDVWNAMDSNVNVLERSVVASGKVGKFGIQPQFQITVPKYQEPGAYSGTLTYTLY